MSRVLHSVAPAHTHPTPHAKRRQRRPPLCLLFAYILLPTEGRICWLLSCHCDFTLSFPSTHSNFPLGELLFIPQDPNPTPLFGEALLAPPLPAEPRLPLMLSAPLHPVLESLLENPL